MRLIEWLLRQVCCNEKCMSLPEWKFVERLDVRVNKNSKISIWYDKWFFYKMIDRKIEWWVMGQKASAMYITNFHPPLSLYTFLTFLHNLWDLYHFTFEFDLMTLRPELYSIFVTYAIPIQYFQILGQYNTIPIQYNTC